MFELTLLEEMPTLTESGVETQPIIEPENTPAVQLQTATPILENPGTEVLSGGIPAIQTLYNLEYGIELSPELLREALVDLGLWNPDGMSLTDIQNFLDIAGTPTFLFNGVSSLEIEAAVDYGLYVLVSGDFGEMLGTDSPDEDAISGENADYMFLVHGIDYNAWGETTVTLYALNGTVSEGITVPLETFEEARADGGADVLIIGRPGYF